MKQMLIIIDDIIDSSIHALYRISPMCYIIFVSS